MKLKKLGLVAAPLLLIGGAGFAYWRMGNSTVESPYLTVPASRANVRQVVASTGTLQAVVTVQVGSQISGTIDKLFADFNTKVKAGQVVARVIPDEPEPTYEPGLEFNPDFSPTTEEILADLRGDAPSA